MAESPPRYAAFGERVRARRTALGISRADLGKRFWPRVNERTVAQWEHGTHKPRGEMRPALVDHLGVEHWWDLFVPEEEAELLTPSQCHLLLTAGHIPSNAYHLFIRSQGPLAKNHLIGLQARYLVESAGPDKKRKGEWLYRLTPWGEEVLRLLREWQP